ncbi:hypothetical protein SKAU_G00153100 [Synaphobranchus kaupii]|uniref:Uncharacterized protein n=1 Tax=Synaphobranchus kaupii TaxID=118154 RepID=A0A9Q1IZ03_SYNKA|nr:hypothetical protein SKAU_G00153100 [Synaphobranchus kaupii]
MGDVLYGRHVWRIGRPREYWDVFSFQKLCADPGNMRPSIVLLERDVMEADKWHNDRSQYLVAPVPMANISQVKTLVRTTGMKIDFPETILYGLSCDSTVIQTNHLLCCLCRWSHGEAGCTDLELLWSHVVCGHVVDWLSRQTVGNGVASG